MVLLQRWETGVKGNGRCSKAEWRVPRRCIWRNLQPLLQTLPFLKSNKQKDKVRAGIKTKTVVAKVHKSSFFLTVHMMIMIKQIQTCNFTHRTHFSNRTMRDCWLFFTWPLLTPPVLKSDDHVCGGSHCVSASGKVYCIPSDDNKNLNSIKHCKLIHENKYLNVYITKPIKSREEETDVQ